jgi:hypothetical protein
MSDESIAERIERLVREEHELRGREEHDSADETALERDRDRLRAGEGDLARCGAHLRPRCAMPATILTTRPCATPQPSSTTCSRRTRRERAATRRKARARAPSRPA